MRTALRHKMLEVSDAGLGCVEVGFASRPGVSREWAFLVSSQGASILAPRLAGLPACACIAKLAYFFTSTA